MNPRIGMWLNLDTKTGLILLFSPSSDGAQPAASMAILGLPGKPVTTTTSSAQPTVAPTSSGLSPAATDKYPLPLGKAGYVVKSFFGDPINFTMNGKLSQVPPNGELFIVLDPGKYTYSANIPGKGEATNSVDLQGDTITGVTFTPQ